MWIQLVSEPTGQQRTPLVPPGKPSTVCWHRSAPSCLLSCGTSSPGAKRSDLPGWQGGRPHEHPCLCCRSRVLTEIRPGIDRVSCSFWQLPLKDASSKSIRNHVAGVSSSSLLNLTVTTLGIGLNLRWEGYITSGCMTGVSSGHSHYLNKSESHFESFMAQLV